jgi:hypothetical protein
MKRILSALYVIILLLTFTSTNYVIASETSVVVLSDSSVASEMVVVRTAEINPYKGEKVRGVPNEATSGYINVSDYDKFDDLPLVIPLNKGEETSFGNTLKFNDLPLLVPLNEGESTNENKAFNDLPLVVPLEK